ncbi:MAG TPA: RdgB/HAM1 family non-canonical purine NTP pyrophosphatase [Candidatus Angelobacter sp.]|nr:RdgB/HAM1 family non-canonical purine NTP pyrophosphatase [Candidatus Angelobacter sp.]
MQPLPKLVIATSNPGKLRDFQGAASNHQIEIEALPAFSSIPQAVESGATFEENARIKAEHYSLFSPGRLVVADDSGLAVDALEGAPGVHSARYAAVVKGGTGHHTNSDDEENNQLLISQLENVPEKLRSGKFICVIAAARDGKTLGTFAGEVEGQLLTHRRSHQGFGYDPLFFFPALNKTFAELSSEAKALYSHRGIAFRHLLDWYLTAKI